MGEEQFVIIINGEYPYFIKSGHEGSRFMAIELAVEKHKRRRDNSLNDEERAHWFEECVKNKDPDVDPNFDWAEFESEILQAYKIKEIKVYGHATCIAKEHGLFNN